MIIFRIFKFLLLPTLLVGQTQAALAFCDQEKTQSFQCTKRGQQPANVSVQVRYKVCPNERPPLHVYFVSNVAQVNAVLRQSFQTDIPVSIFSASVGNLDVTAFTISTADGININCQ